MKNFLTFGDRLFALRASLGEGPRKPMPLREFDDWLFEKSGRRFHPSELSKMERNERGPSLEDAKAIASVDPEGHDLNWWAGVGTPAASTPQEEIAKIPFVAEEPIADARAAARLRSAGGAGPDRRPPHREGRRAGGTVGRKKRDRD